MSARNRMQTYEREMIMITGYKMQNNPKNVFTMLRSSEYLIAEGNLDEARNLLKEVLDILDLLETHKKAS